MCDGTAAMSGQWSDKMIVASSLLGAYGSVQQGSQASAFYNYKANQAIADAAAERGAGAVRAGKVMKAGRFAQGEVTAAYAGSGIDVGSGSSLAVKEQLQRNISEDATAQLLTGERRARSLEVQAAGDRIAAVNARTSGTLGAARSLLTGAATAMDAENSRSKWIKRSQAEAARSRALAAGDE